MPTFNFTYPVPDETWVENWSDGLDATLPYIGPATLDIWFDEITGHIKGSTFDLQEGETAWPGETPAGTPGPTKITVNAADGDKSVAALWFAKLKSEYQTMTDEEYPAEITTHINTDGKDYHKITNPRPDHLFECLLEDGGNAIQFSHIIKFPETHHEYECKVRKAKVQWYNERYDLGTAAEADATTFVGACDTYLAAQAENQQWMYIVTPTSGIPKIPLSVMTAISTITSAVGDEFVAPTIMDYIPTIQFWE